MAKPNKTAAYRDVPPWVQLFLIHVMKRFAGILVAWIDEMQEANREVATVERGNYNNR